MVSIHAFREEGDGDNRLLPSTEIVSIHAFREEGDRKRFRQWRNHGSFNPRLPGGRRRAIVYSLSTAEVVSIHAFREEGDQPARQQQEAPVVSIHAFREEGDSSLML